MAGTNDREVLEAKLALENEIAFALFNALGTYVWAWARAEGSLDIFAKSGHQNAIERTLATHYARTAMVMTGRTPPARPTLDEAALSLKHAGKLAARAQSQARRMIESLDRDLIQTHQRVEMEQAATVEQKAEGDHASSFTVRYLAKFMTTAQQVLAKVKGKIKTIANIETQEAAETSRFEWVEQQNATGRIVKVWSNMGDERVRGNPDGIYARSKFDHWSVEGQEVLVDQPFTVSGEKLMFPGDNSLGASLGNLINCGCSARYIAVGPNGEREPLGLETIRIPARRTWHRGDRQGIETPVRPTSTVTLNGNTRARVILGDGRTFATMRQTTPSTIEIVVNRRVVARATASGDRVTTLTVAQGFEGQGIDRLIRASVAHSARRSPAPQ